MPDVRHSIKVVSKRTGLSPHVIRVWEKRYATVSPERTEGNRRLYRAQDVERLRLLKLATDAGHSIGDIAQLPTERLARLVSDDLPAASAAPPAAAPAQGLPAGSPVAVSAPAPDPAVLVATAFEAVQSMNAEALGAVLEQAAVALGQMRLLGEVVVPLVERIGNGWRDGTVKVAQEHVATATIRTCLGQLARPMTLHPSAPAIVVTTPAGQVHELGAVIAAAVARAGGWRVIYAGPSLPAEEIVSAVMAQRAVAVALSIVHPSDDPELPGELKRLRRLLPERVHLVVGGRASASYATALAECGATMVRDVVQLASSLERLRAGVG